jgi:hypothetical protein
LFAHGLVLWGGGDPIVIVSLDWCEVRNESYERWRAELARAAATSRERVLLSCVHQHDAPYTDRVAQELLTRAGVIETKLCDTSFEDRMISRCAEALRDAARKARRVTHIGAGQARIEQLASNRRYLRPDGTVSWGRTSATRDPALRALPEGLIDPFVKTISFWDGDTALAALSCYSTHPMSYYGKGDVSADFVGMARATRQRATPGVIQIYASGCSGDTIAGKYNDGSPEMRPILASRLSGGIERAWAATRRTPVEGLRFRNAKLRLAPRAGAEFTIEAFERRLEDTSLKFQVRSEAALGLAWRKRLDAGHSIDVPCISLGPVDLLLLPAEAFVQYQLWAQEARPNRFVIALGYGECAPGYIPTARDAAEGYDDHYSWIAFPECERPIRAAVKETLG